MYADVILPLNLPQTLTYGVPQEMHDIIKPGMRVAVALGKNKQYAGIVEQLHEHKPATYMVKPIKALIDEFPVVTAVQLQFWRWITQYYMAAPGEVMQAALPAHLKLSGETRLAWLGIDDSAIVWSLPAQPVVEALQLRKEITISELKMMAGDTFIAAVLQELLEHEAVSVNDSLEATYRPKREKIVTLSHSYSQEAALIALFDKLERAPRQLELLMAFMELRTKNKVVRQIDLLERTDATAALVKIMADKGIFDITERDVDRIAPYKGEGREVVLTDAQQTAYDQLTQCLDEKAVTLLHGVTGSGKTLLYIHKIRECLAAGKQAIFMLPEIGLTTQIVGRLKAYFGEKLGVYHSSFSNNERVEIWEKVRTGQYQVILGPRSVLWLPYIHPGLIIIDEEHDVSYKQKEPAPRFHARDAAIFLASLFGARVVLGSATPSVETLYNVHQKKYGYVPLKDRYMGVKMPEITVVNAKSLDAAKKQGPKLLTPELVEAMSHALHGKTQIILFQNRRGYAPFQVCVSCGWIPQCKNCAVSLTYHKTTDKLHCHYCGAREHVVHVCPQCGNNKLISKSFGTEKIEEEVQMLFPDAKVARMDVDSMKGKNTMNELLEQVEQRKVDILVGTQMVVKGLDFASVSLVGILSSDGLLSFPDFRVNERAFQLMEQVSGRAGRMDGEGKVLIQAYNMNHPVLEWVKRHDVHAFYSYEIQYRAYFSYPPFSRLIKIILKHKEEHKVAIVAQQMAATIHTFQGIVVQGPGAAIVPRVRNQFIQEIWIKSPRENKLLDELKAFLKQEKQIRTAQRGFTAVQIIFDVDPY